jgi:hypothetical protein
VFSTDTRSTVSNVLSSAKQLAGHAGASDSGNAGYYFCGSLSSTKYSAIEKLNFSNDTGSVLTATLAADTNFQGAASNNGAGY